MTVYQQFGALLEVDLLGGSDFSEVAQVTLVAVPGSTATPINITPHSALVELGGRNQLIPSRRVVSEPLTYTMNYEKDHAQQIGIEAAVKTGPIPHPRFRTTTASGRIDTFPAIVSSFKVNDLDSQTDAAETVTNILEPSGEVVTT